MAEILPPGLPTSSDWDKFFSMAHRERWRFPHWEKTRLRNSRPGEAFVLRQGENVLGFVTVTPHQRNGWIGNLLVVPACRRMGYGSLLFEHALAALESRGCAAIWLTASESGRPLYENRGFLAVCGITRWLRSPGRPSTITIPSGDAVRFFRADTAVWGENRQALLSPIVRDGTVLGDGETAALLQKGGPMRLLGPWISQTCCSRENHRILGMAADLAGEKEIVADVLDLVPVSPLLRAAGFTPVGQTVLMKKGAVSSGTNPLPGLVSLASLGSMG